MCVHSQEQASASLRQLRDGVSPRHLFIPGHVGVGCEAPGQGLSYPAQHPRGCLLTASEACHDPCPPVKGAWGLKRAGGWGHWEGFLFTAAWLPLGLPCQLDGQVSSRTRDPALP